MKNAKIRKLLLVAIGGLFVWWASKSPAQDVAGNNPALQMPDAVTQVLELEQAKIADATIIAYINSSGTSFNLNAAQIVFLRQQGLSDAVITAMLTQPRTGVSVQPTISAPPPATATSATYAGSATDPTVITQPQTAYVQTAPASAPYSYSYYPYQYSYPYSYSYCPTYTYYAWPRVWWPFGWAWYGGGWHWGWGGSWHGGAVAWHGGSGWHGGWNGGFHGGWGGGSHGGGRHH